VADRSLAQAEPTGVSAIRNFPPAWWSRAPHARSPRPRVLMAGERGATPFGRLSFGSVADRQARELYTDPLGFGVA
jgi:hypothetical protein